MTPWTRAQPARPTARFRTPGAANRAATSSAALVALCAVAACSVSAGQNCTAVGGTNSITVNVQPEVRAELASLRLELCQSDTCADVTFPAASLSEYGIYIRDGVALNENAYTVDLGALGTEWDADAPSRLTVRGAGAGGATVVRRTESFEFDQSYPNGRGCDPDPYLSYRARIDDGDRVR